MKIENLQDIIKNGEGITVEFKESKRNINKNAYESVCAFLNRYGGQLFLGVKDNGEIAGVEGDTFKTIIPLTARPGEHASEHASAHLGEHANAHDVEHGENQYIAEKILGFCREPKTRMEIQEFLDIKSRSYISQKVLSPLIKGGLLKLVIPDKPKSPNQKYYSQELKVTSTNPKKFSER